jgi:hypothetical protein
MKAHTKAGEKISNSQENKKYFIKREKERIPVEREKISNTVPKKM